MISPLIPHNEEARLLNLYAHEILDSGNDPDFNDLVEIAAELCQCPMSLISLIDADRQWFKAKKGVEIDETPREISFCGHTILSADVMVVSDATKDIRFADSPIVTGGPSVNFYMGAPIISTDGYALGSICVLDVEPRELNENQKNSLQLLSRQVTRLLELKLKTKRLEESAMKIRAESEKCKEAKEDAERATLVKSRFLSTMSHEIRTPMNAVIGFTNLLAQNARPDQQEYLKVLEFSAANLMSLINDVLDFNKIEEGKIVFENTAFNLTDLVQNIQRSFQQRADEKGLYLKINADSKLPEFMMGDPMRLNQILTNLVGNAIKFTDYGGVTLNMTVMSEDDVDLRVSFEVTDTGIGIPASEHNAVFNMFTQASSETSRLFGGSGLGLAIVKKLLNLQGCSISLQSAPGKGSSFYFEIGFDKAQITARSTPDTTENSSTLNELQGLKILLAEDNPINVMLAKELLRQWGVECDVAFNGKGAIQSVLEKEYDLVLMDIQMPEMDGFEATEAIRNLPGEKYQTLPIIALTASASIEDKGNVLSAGMNNFVTKPFLPEELRMKILNQVKNRLTVFSISSGNIAGDNQFSIASRRIENEFNLAVRS